MAEEANTTQREKAGEAVTVTPAQPGPSENYLVVEHLETMPSMFARGLFYVTFLLVVVGLAYSFLAKIDVVVTCRAVARPGLHKTKVLADRNGYITQVFISEGQRIERDAPLFRVRSKEIVSYQAKVAELRRTIPLTAESYDTKVAAARGQLERCDSQHSNAVKVIRLKLEQNELSIKSTEADLTYWNKEVQRLAERFARMKELHAKGVASVQERDQAKSDLERARAEADKLTSKKSIALKQKSILEQNLAEETANYKAERGALEKEITKLQLEKTTTLESMRAELAKNERMLSIKGGAATQPAGDDEGDVIRAGTAGTISEVYFRTEGEYIRQSDLLCTIVPAGSPLYMDIVVPNPDIGFIEEGMPVKYKFDAFPYADYGMLRGTVASIPPSAVEDPQLGFVYRVRGALGQRHFEINDKHYPIKAGMTATAELVTERRTLLTSLFRRR